MVGWLQHFGRTAPVWNKSESVASLLAVVNLLFLALKDFLQVLSRTFSGWAALERRVLIEHAAFESVDTWTVQAREGGSGPAPPG